MRDAFGGTFMIYVFIVFLVVYVTFVAVAFNYARAFRVKNKVIDIIEQNEGIDFTNTSGAIGNIETYLNSVSYKVNGIDKDTNSCLGYEYINKDRGYCITVVNGGAADYYKVVTFVRLELPFMDLGFTIPVKGETRKIERVTS